MESSNNCMTNSANIGLRTHRLSIKEIVELEKEEFKMNVIHSIKIKDILARLAISNRLC